MCSESREIDPESKPKQDYNYHFPIDLTLNGVLFSAKQSSLLVLNQSEKSNYNPALVWISKIQKIFLRVPLLITIRIRTRLPDKVRHNFIFAVQTSSQLTEIWSEFLGILKQKSDWIYCFPVDFEKMEFCLVLNQLKNCKCNLIIVDSTGFRSQLQAKRNRLSCLVE